MLNIHLVSYIALHLQETSVKQLGKKSVRCLRYVLIKSGTYTAWLNPELLTNIGVMRTSKNWTEFF